MKNNQLPSTRLGVMYSIRTFNTSKWRHLILLMEYVFRDLF
jgi:hypothetical protein